MKTMKKLTSLLLVLLMVVGMMSITAWAAGETGTITIDNPQAGATYTAYKIFDVVYSESNYSYTISKTDNPWFSVVETYAKTTGSGLTLTATAANSNVYVVTIDDAYSAADFAAYLKDHVPVGAVGEQLTNDGSGKVVAKDLDLGYYFVDNTSGALCNLTTTDSTAEIHDKNDIVFDKEDDKQDVEIGETVTYTITGKVPATEGFKNYIYRVSDTMSKGLTFDGLDSITIEVGGETLDAQYYNKYAKGEKYPTYDENGELKDEADWNTVDADFMIIIDVMSLEFGKDIEIKYTATVNENAIASVEKNDAKLEYSNDPSDWTGTGTLTDTEYVYTAEIIIEKVDGEGAPLPGAKFVLQNSDGKYYKYVAATAEKPAHIEWVDDIKEATEVTTTLNADGTAATASFPGLKEGTYYLVETEAPAGGYNLLTERKVVVVTGTTNQKSPTDETDPGNKVVTENDEGKDKLDDSITSSSTKDDVVTVECLQYTSEVENNTGSLLPETGGIGTTIFYAVGGLLAVGAVILLITKRRMGTEE